MMTAIAIAPNASIQNNVLVVNGHQASINHSEDFRQIAAATAAVIATVLAQVLPEPCFPPALDGSHAEQTVEPWRHYSELALKLKQAASHEAILDAGRGMLAWCALACAVADITRLDAREEGDFLVARYLALHGGGLSRTPQEWTEFLRQLEAYRSLPSNLRMDLPEPRPVPGLSVQLPWPEQLGIQLGGSEHLVENILRVAADIRLADSYTRVVSAAAGYTFQLAPTHELQRICLDACGASSQGMVDLPLDATRYQLRVQRTPMLDGEVFTARVVAATPIHQASACM